MKIISTIQEMHEYTAKLKRRGHAVGFVPTMGALHAGHISLVAAAAKDNIKVVVSIFVNPAQFAPGEDLEKYPRPIKRDLKMLKDTKMVDCVFTPQAQEMYPEGYATYVGLEDEMIKKLDGISRPAHFRGVTTIVAKFLNIVKPDRLYLGQKDAQQAAILSKMVKDMDYPAKVVVCPIVREKDGLAMSSRNAYLTPEERGTAPELFKSLQMAESMVELGERSCETVKKEIRRKLKEENIEIDYIEVVGADNLDNLEKIQGRILIAAAIYVGRTRLIDNVVMEIKS